MNFYIVLGQSNHPIANQLFTEADIERMKKQPQAAKWSFVPIQVPWQSAQWAIEGGAGNSPYKEKRHEITTIKVPRSIAHETKQYAVWLSQQQ